MTTLNDAIELILKNTVRMKSETKPLQQCLGQVLAEDIFSPYTLPMTQIGGPDGYAVRAEDIAGASPENPVELRIRAISRAGCPAKKAVLPGTAIRIMTGSVLPDGADCVIRFEDTDEPGNKNGPNPDNPEKVRIFVEGKPGEGIRPQGGEIGKGELLLPEGTLLAPHHISALASVGMVSVTVVRRPVLGVIPTGDELMKPGKPLVRGKVYDCNGPAVAAFVQQYGGIAKHLGIARDREGALDAKLDRAAGVDAIVTSGGVSKGDYDLVRLVLGRRGHIVFARIMMGPGASVAFAMIQRPGGKDKEDVIPVFSLAGPPTGCLVNLETLLRPALLKMRGLTLLDHPAVPAVPTESVRKKPPFSFARWSRLEPERDGYRVDLQSSAGMGSLLALAHANALTIITGDKPLQEGERIDVLPLEWWQRV